MSQADHSGQQDTSHRESSDDRTEFERLLRLVAHGFEGNSEKNLPRLSHSFPPFAPVAMFLISDAVKA